MRTRRTRWAKTTRRMSAHNGRYLHLQLGACLVGTLLFCRLCLLDLVLCFTTASEPIKAPNMLRGASQSCTAMVGSTSPHARTVGRVAAGDTQQPSLLLPLCWPVAGCHACLRLQEGPLPQGQLCRAACLGPRPPVGGKGSRQQRAGQQGQGQGRPAVLLLLLFACLWLLSCFLLGNGVGEMDMALCGCGRGRKHTSSACQRPGGMLHVLEAYCCPAILPYKAGGLLNAAALGGACRLPCLPSSGFSATSGLRTSAKKRPTRLASGTCTPHQNQPAPAAAVMSSGWMWTASSASVRQRLRMQQCQQVCTSTG